MLPIANLLLPTTKVVFGVFVAAGPNETAMLLRPPDIAFAMRVSARYFQVDTSQVKQPATGAMVGSLP